MNHCVVDIETLAVPEEAKNPYVLSLGAMVFNDDLSLRKYFYRRFDQNQHGVISEDTKQWWNRQNPIVKKLAGFPCKEKIKLEVHDCVNSFFDIKWARMNPIDAMKDFRIFAHSSYVERYWGNSPTFDMRILDIMHNSLEFNGNETNRLLSLPPWKETPNKSKFWMERDVRTLKDIHEMFKIDINEYKFVDYVKHDFKKNNLLQLVGVLHFALSDAIEEASIVYNTNMFLSKCKEVLES